VLRHFCYPSGEHQSEVFSTLKNCEIDSATTTEFGLASRHHSTLCLPRILDGESFSLLDLEARLSGFWSLLTGLRQGFRRGLP
jgi:hypothetical protein